jgi:hypothetical protein
MRALMPDLEVDDQGLNDIGEGICVWYDDGVSYPEALDSMEFLGADEALGATVIASAVEHLCPLAWPAQHRNASGSSVAPGPSSSEPVEPAPPAVVAPAAPVQEAPSPAPRPACPTAKDITVTAELTEMTPFSDTAYGVTLTGWKYKVRTTVRNAADVSATVVTAVMVNGPYGMIDSSVEPVEGPAKGSQAVTSYEMVAYDDKPVGLQVDPVTDDLGTVTSTETCQR